jgi:BirA family transcriptional regulator, biotin operon repressor / biotin---[acetyl-CoA-carboxylase] ligase
MRVSHEKLYRIQKDLAIQVLGLLEERLQEKGYEIKGLKQTLLDSESTKMRSIFCLPNKKEDLEKRKPNEKVYSVYPHFDMGFLSTHIKDQYLLHKSEHEKPEELEFESEGGLIIRNRDGVETFVRLKEGDIMIQGGLALQILTGGILKAQAHGVLSLNVPNISRSSHITFFQPKLSTSLKCPSFTDINTVLSLSAKDENFINPRVFLSNHFKDGDLWVDVHHNQIMRFLFYGLTRNLYQDRPAPDFRSQSLSFPEGKLTINHFNFDYLESTQDIAKKIATNYSDYLSRDYYFAISSKEQTKGRGQGQNKWLSPPASNLYVTYALCLPPSLGPFVIFAATASVVSAIKEMFPDLNPKIKWVNDVFVNEKKVSGILLENIFVEDKLYSVLGIGVNLNSDKEDFVDLPEASSILLESKDCTGSIDVNKFFSVLTHFFVKNLDELNRDGFPSIFSQIEKRMEYLNEKVVILNPQTNEVLHEGIFEKLQNHDGSVILSLENGERKNIISGRMRKKK